MVLFCRAQGHDWVEAREIVLRLVDIVSKGGNYLLNVGPTSEGLIPQPSINRLMEVGAWLEMNGEAIYGTSPWKVFHDGPPSQKAVNARKENRVTAVDIRFTAKGKSIYAICLAWPEQDVPVRALGHNQLPDKTIAAVRMLGSKEEIRWRQTEDELALSVPREKPCRYAFVYQIDLNKQSRNDPWRPSTPRPDPACALTEVNADGGPPSYRVQSRVGGRHGAPCTVTAKRESSMTSKFTVSTRVAASLAVARSLILSAGARAQQVHQAEVAGAGPSAAQIADGRKVYETICQACHQADGKGLPGAFPPLAGSDYLLGNPDRAARVVVNGLQGEVEVNGIKYNSVMPAMTQLSDKEIADALTYAMNSWADRGGAVSVTAVAVARAKAEATPKKAESPTQHMQPAHLT